MNRELALGLFLGTCVVLAVLLLLGIIGAPLEGFVFAAALILFGGLSRGFRNGSAIKRTGGR